MNNLEQGGNFNNNESGTEQKSLKERMMEFQKYIVERFEPVTEQAIIRVSENPYFRELESTSF